MNNETIIIVFIVIAAALDSIDLRGLKTKEEAKEFESPELAIARYGLFLVH